MEEISKNEERHLLVPVQQLAEVRKLARQLALHLHETASPTERCKRLAISIEESLDEVLCSGKSTQHGHVIPSPARSGLTTSTVTDVEQRVVPVGTRIPTSKRRKTGREWKMKTRVRAPGDGSCPGDGYSWRKYGQKDILGSKYPRCYYRCSQRQTSGCGAMKQVQRSNDDNYFDVKYEVEHRCGRLPEPMMELALPDIEDVQDTKIRNTENKVLLQTSSSFNVSVPDDGYSWRKYAQKDIPGFKHPSGYYRCTHSNTRGCSVKKKVQRTDDDPTVFEVTYQGTHTCVLLPLPIEDESPLDIEDEQDARNRKSPPISGDDERGSQGWVLVDKDFNMLHKEPGIDCSMLEVASENRARSRWARLWNVIRANNAFLGSGQGKFSSVIENKHMMYGKAIEARYGACPDDDYTWSNNADSACEPPQVESTVHPAKHQEGPSYSQEQGKSVALGGDDERGVGNWSFLSLGGDDERGIGNWRLPSVSGDDGQRLEILNSNIHDSKMEEQNEGPSSSRDKGKSVALGGDDERGVGTWSLQSLGGDDERGIGNWRLPSLSGDDKQRLECLNMNIPDSSKMDEQEQGPSSSTDQGKSVALGGDDERGVGNWPGLVSVGGDDERGVGNWSMPSPSRDSDTEPDFEQVKNHGSDMDET